MVQLVFQREEEVVGEETEIVDMHAVQEVVQVVVVHQDRVVVLIHVHQVEVVVQEEEEVEEDVVIHLHRHLLGLHRILVVEVVEEIHVSVHVVILHPLHPEVEVIVATVKDVEEVQVVVGVVVGVEVIVEEEDVEEDHIHLLHLVEAEVEVRNKHVSNV